MNAVTTTLKYELTDEQFEKIRRSGFLTSYQVQHVLDRIQDLERIEDIPDDRYEDIRMSGQLTSTQVSHVLAGIVDAQAVAH